MKSTRFFLLSLLVTLLTSFTTVEAQESLTASQWQEDVRFLQSSVHKDYPFLFKKTTAAAFDGAVEKLLNDIPNLEEHQIRVGLARLVASFQYGHTQVPFGSVVKKGILPVNLYSFPDGVYIEGVHKDHASVLGAKILKIGDTPIDKALELVYPAVPVENSQYFKAYGMRFLTSPEVLHAQGIIPSLTEKVTLTLEKEGSTFTYDLPTIPIKDKPKAFNFTLPTENWLTARNTEKTPLYLKDLAEKYYFFEYLEDSKTVYVRQSSVFDHESESLADFYKRLFNFIDTNEVNKLVYDVRLNGGGNNYNNLALIKGLMARPQINQQGKFFFIIGRDTFSACQNLTNEITRYTEAILVGEPTAENVNFYGDTKPVRLPNSGINAYLSYAWWQDVAPWENRDYSVPHIAVESTYEQYISNQDPVLEAAMSFENSDFILDPMQHLTQLFMQNKMEQLKRDSAEIVQNPMYRYYDFEKEFSQAGDRLLETGNLPGGILVLELVTANFPESIGTWYSLAGAYEKLENKSKAIEAYEKIVELQPKGLLARSAKQRIENLRK